MPKSYAKEWILSYAIGLEACPATKFSNLTSPAKVQTASLRTSSSILKASPNTRTNALRYLIQASNVGSTSKRNLLQAMMPNSCVADGQ